MTIHWWRTDRLAAELANDQVSEAQSLWYAVCSSLINYAALYYATWFGGYRSWLLIVEFLVVSVIVAIGLQECFKANGGPVGHHYLKRLFCLGVPIGIKTFVFGIAVGNALYYGFPRMVTTESFRNPYLVYQLVSISVAGLLVVLYFWWIAYYLDRIAKLEGDNHRDSTPSIEH